MLPEINLWIVQYWLVFILAVLVFCFLFWRANKHELLDDKLAFDLLLVWAGSAFLFGRLFEFLAQYQRFEWSLTKIFFFNRFGGLDFYGALFGVGLATWLYSRNKKIKPWSLLDIAAAPAVFAQSIVALGGLARDRFNSESIYFYFSIAYWLIFLILKRLATKKRFDGFFAIFYLISICGVDMVLFVFRDNISYLGGKVPYELVMPALFLATGVVSWLYLSGIGIGRLIKNFLAIGLLSAMRTRIVSGSVDEAGKISRAIIFSPYSLGRAAPQLVKLVLKELRAMIADFLAVIGVKR